MSPPSAITTLTGNIGRYQYTGAEVEDWSR